MKIFLLTGDDAKNHQKQHEVLIETSDDVYETTPSNRNASRRHRCDARVVVTICGLFACLLVLLHFRGIFVSRLSGEEAAQNDAWHAFQRFVQIYEKTYPSAVERDRRFSIFVQNLIDLDEERRKQPDVSFDFYPWMDRTTSEIRSKLFLAVDGDRPMPAAPEGHAPPFDSFDERVARPAAHSLRDKSTPAKDQGQCGSCWAFAVVASVETAVAIKKGGAPPRLSEQELVDCDTRNMGCNGGVRQYAMNFVMRNGLVDEAKYPYVAKRHPECALTKNDTRVYITDFRNLAPNEETMADWVFKTGPLTFGMNVTKGMYGYRSGIFTPGEHDCQHGSDGSHALTIMGYGSEGGKDYWLVKNSWGSFWGDQGFFKLARGVNSCGMANNVVATIL